MRYNQRNIWSACVFVGLLFLCLFSITVSRNRGKALRRARMEMADQARKIHELESARAQVYSVRDEAAQLLAEASEMQAEQQAKNMLIREELVAMKERNKEALTELKAMRQHEREAAGLAASRPTAPPPPSRREYSVDANVRTGRNLSGAPALIVVNKSDWVWNNVRVTLNDGIFGGGYYVDLSVWEPEAQRDLAFHDFATRRGARFNYALHKVREVTIKAFPNTESMVSELGVWRFGD